MWVPSKLLSLFSVDIELVNALKEQLAEAKAQRDAYREEAITNKTNFNWLTIRVNALEAERAQLVRKVYGIEVPVPEIVRTPSTPDISAFSFEDIGDEEARKIGLPLYDTN